MVKAVPLKKRVFSAGELTRGPALSTQPTNDPSSLSNGAEQRGAEPSNRGFRKTGSKCHLHPCTHGKQDRIELRPPALQ